MAPVVIQYHISKHEVERRTRAFTTLIVFLMIGLILSGYQFILEYWWFAISSLVIVFLVFLIFRILTVKFFKTFLKTKVDLGSDYLERITVKSQNKFLLKSVKEIEVKRTKRGDIREIKIVFTDNETLFLDALENIGEFKDKLIGRCPKSITFKETTEPIDYDHPFFYVVLGLLVGFLSITALSVISSFNSTGIRIVFYLISLYVMIMGAYFLMNKPLLKRYGNKSQTIDYILGIVMVISAVVVFILGRMMI